MRTQRGGPANFLIGVATALVIVAVTLPLFLNPTWVAVEQGRSQAAAWTGLAEPDLRFATNEILADLVVGPPDFDVAIRGAAVLNERERLHMRDVRGVFIAFFVLAGLAAAVAIVVVVRRHGSDRARTWRAVRNGAIGLIIGLIVVGGISFVAFDALFDTFHRLFFPGGSYTFDPRTERLVQLFPFQFWQETAIAVGAVAIILAAVTASVAGRRIREDPGRTHAPTLETTRP